MASTIKDVADMAGVSISTVSKYMNGGHLRDKYQKRVEQAVRALDYSVNEVARNLKMNRTMMIGILASDITSSFVSSIIKNIQISLSEKGYTTLILDYQESKETEWKQFRVLTRWKVDGIILFPWFNEKDLCEKIKALNIPLILVDNLIYGYEEEAVISNNYESSFQITEKLIEAGHQRIGFFRGTHNAYTSDERKRGYVDAMSQHHLEVMIEEGFYSIEGGYEATKRFLAKENRPTALLSSNYHMTIGMLRALTEAGIRIPEDISVAAFDKQDFDFALRTSLSSVIQPQAEIGKKAAELILKKIENANRDLQEESKVHILNTEMVLTDSIRKN